MKKMFFAAFVACAFLTVSCSSNVDKVIDLKNEQATDVPSPIETPTWAAEAVKEFELKKAAELEKEVANSERALFDEDTKQRLKAKWQETKQKRESLNN